MSIVAAFAVPHPPIIVAGVGRGEETAVQATIDAYRQVARAVARLAPDTVVVTSPHAPAYLDAFAICDGSELAGSMADFGDPEDALSFAVDTAFAEDVELGAHARNVYAARSAWRGREMDHACFVPLYFVAQETSAFKVVEIGLAGLPASDHFALGQVIADVARHQQKRVVFIASGDLSHELKATGPYGFVPEGPKLDAAITRAFADNDLDELFHIDPELVEKGAECGLRSFQIMAGALSDVPHTGKLLSYEGTFGVGYGVASFLVEGAEAASPAAPAESAGDPFVRLAHEAIVAYTLRRERLAIPNWVPADLRTRRAACFVSIHEEGDLRGCIGTLEPCRDSLASEVIDNAISACSRDPRFAPVRADELPLLDVNVDVLTEPEAIESARELDPARFGVIVSRGGRRGVLLPDLDGVDTVAQQVAIAKRKAGIGADEPVALERFEVTRHYDDKH